MQELLITISAIALVDSINPNAIAVQVYLLSTPNPTYRSIAFIVGDYLAAWITGLLIAFGMTQLISQVLTHLGNAIYLLQFLLGIALLFVGYHITKLANHPTVHLPKSLKPQSTFLLGFTMAFVEAPTALPYIAAIERMTRANLTLLKLVAMLALYCFIFVLPLIGVLAIHTVLQNRATHVLARIQKLVYRWFYRWVFPVFRVIIIALGVVLILDSFTQLFGASII